MGLGSRVFAGDFFDFFVSFQPYYSRPVEDCLLFYVGFLCTERL